MVKNRTFLNSQNRTFLLSCYNHTSYNTYYVKLNIRYSELLTHIISPSAMTTLSLSNPLFDLSTKKIPHNRGIFLRHYQFFQ